MALHSGDIGMVVVIEGHRLTACQDCLKMSIGILIKSGARIGSMVHIPVFSDDWSSTSLVERCPDIAPDSYTYRGNYFDLYYSGEPVLIGDIVAFQEDGEIYIIDSIFDPKEDKYAPAAQYNRGTIWYTPLLHGVRTPSIQDEPYNEDWRDTRLILHPKRDRIRK